MLSFLSLRYSSVYSERLQAIKGKILEWKHYSKQATEFNFWLLNFSIVWDEKLERIGLLEETEFS